MGFPRRPRYPDQVSAGARTFVVAQNPDPDSALPHVMRLPLDGGIAFRARERWPATVRVCCHPLDNRSRFVFAHRFPAAALPEHATPAHAAS